MSRSRFSISPAARAALIRDASLFAVGFILFFAVLSSFDLMYDGDSYIHLAVAREYAQSGYTDGLRWARFSVMHKTFGDKELLFHALLAPFTQLSDPLEGAAVAHALLLAGIWTIIGHLAVSAIGPWGLLIPLWLFATSASFTLRLLRLRPEMLSLLLLLLAAWAAERGRWRLLAPIAAVYALSYTAFHALLGLAFGWTIWIGWMRRRVPWPLLLWPLVGVAVGLLLHPGFPDNLRIWTIQSIDFWAWKNVLDVGKEILPPNAGNMLGLNYGWWLGLLVLAASVERGKPPETVPPNSIIWPLSALAFALLYFKAARMAVYFMPFLTLALLTQLHARGYRLSRFTRLPVRGRIPFVLTFGVCLALGLSGIRETQGNLVNNGVFDPERKESFREVARRLPEGATVATDWGPAEWYTWFAPQARYLNVLDPVFMAIPYPEKYGALDELFAGKRLDTPLTVRKDLESEYLLISRYGDRRQLLRRVLYDPRVQVLTTGIETLVRIRENANDAFVLDWRDARTGRPWPRSADAPGSGVEGFVDLSRIGPVRNCRTLTHTLRLEAPTHLVYELAPWGPTEWRVDGEIVASVLGTPQAFLGESAGIALELDAGEHRYEVRTCPTVEHSGFYLLERQREPLGEAQGEKPSP